MSDPIQRLRQVLAGQQFPADRWQLIATAEFYGADGESRRELWELPPARFRTLADVLQAVEQRTHAIAG